MNAPSPKGQTDALIDPMSLRSLDAGTRSQVALLEALLKEQKRENDRLRKLVKRFIPVPIAGVDVASPFSHQTAPVKQWLKEIRQADWLEIDELGVRVTRNARPRMVIMSDSVLKCLSQLCGERVSEAVTSYDAL